jgi:diguanylate cyclase (GGDEF)-like protein
VAQRISRGVRAVDVVARFGGDEFVVILNELGTDRLESTQLARVVAEKLRAALAKPHVLNVRQEGRPELTVQHHCTASIGVVVFLNHEGSQDELLKWADAAMYQAQPAGGNLIRLHDI